MSSSFQCGYGAFDLFFPFPKSNSASQYANNDGQRPTSIVDLTARVPCRFFTFAEHVSFEHSAGSPWPVIYSGREGNINKQTYKTQKFLHTQSSIRQSASPCSYWHVPVFGRSAASARSGAGAATFRSNRKYRYRPHTQSDVGNCWPCRKTALGSNDLSTLPLKTEVEIFRGCARPSCPSRITPLPLNFVASLMWLHSCGCAPVATLSFLASWSIAQPTDSPIEKLSFVLCTSVGFKK